MKTLAKASTPNRATSATVAEKVRAVVRLHNRESPGVPLSISAVCRLAGVNRSNLYVHRKDLLQEIRSISRPTPAITRTKAVRYSKPRSEDAAHIKRKSRALLYLCLEQQLEIRSLQRRLQQWQRRIEDKRRPRGTT